MGNKCSWMNTCSCICRQVDDDEAANALLNGLDYPTSSRPCGPPPPYQAEAPFYAMTDEQQVQWMQRLTMIQGLPLGRYDTGSEKKEKELKLEPSEEVQGIDKKAEKERECSICMVDFTAGQPIRLLPCMHYYHMRCIDDWLMRSYSCPICMERVDVGLRETFITSAASHHPNLRRRRRRRERRSTSSILSGASVVSAHEAVERCSKERDDNYRQFVIPGDYEQRLLARQSSQEGPQGNNAGEVKQHDASERDHLTNGGQACDDMQEITIGNMEYVSSSNPEISYDIDQIIHLSNFEVDPQDSQLSLIDNIEVDPQLSLIDVPIPSSPHTIPLSPPLFEYHFQFPLGLQTNHCSQ